MLLLEASARLGGWLQSTRTADGAVFEHGPRGIRPAGVVGTDTLHMVGGTWGLVRGAGAWGRGCLGQGAGVRGPWVGAGIWRAPLTVQFQGAGVRGGGVSLGGCSGLGEGPWVGVLGPWGHKGSGVPGVQ